MGKIIGTGFHVPHTVVRNEDITEHSEWVEENIGIKERRSSASWQGSLFLGLNAGLDALTRSGLQATAIDMVIVATSTPEKIAPSTACLIKHELELVNAVAFDINAVCSGFLYALSIAEQSNFNNTLIICVDVFSKITDYSSRDCVFFGDGAGAVVVTKGDNLRQVTIGSDTDSNGFTCDHGSTFEMDKHLVYDTALRVVPAVIKRALFLSGTKIDEIDYMIPHQPSKRILNDIADKIGLPREKVLMNMDRYANTSAATIPILLAESWDMFKKGDKLLFAAIGAGWTYGAAIYEV